jgi:pimeloyl-ACP methyl ester carboxylesterase
LLPNADTVTLKGLGERAAEAAPEIDVTAHAADIARAVDAAGEGVIVVAHSYAGFPAEVALSAIANRVARLVHLDAFVPQGGDCILDYFPPPIAAQIRAAGPFVDPLPAHMFGLVAPEDIAWVMPRLTKQPLAAMTERVAASTANVPRTYIECTLGGAEKPFAFFAEKARAKGWQYATLETGHDAMVTAPEALAKLLASLP